MASESVHIDDIYIQKIRSLFSSGELPAPGIRIINDKTTPGLRLQIEGKKASWVVKTSKNSKTIGCIHPSDAPRCLSALSKVRALALEVKLYLDNNQQDKCKPFLDHYYANKAGSIKQASDAANAYLAKRVEEVKEAARVKTLTLRECFEKTIEEKRVPSHVQHISKAMKKDMEITLNRPLFETIMKKEAKDVTQDDIEKVRDDVMKEARSKGQKGISPSNKIIVHTRSALDYCARYIHGESGLDGRHPWWKFLSVKHKNTPRDRCPSIKDVVKTLILAENYLDKPLPGRANRMAGVSPGTLAGLWWIVLTAQRADAGLSLRTHNIGEDKNRPNEGWLLAAWDGSDMKAGKSFVLPIPERAWKHVCKFRKRNTNAKSKLWAFPSDVKKGVHASTSGIYRIVYRLASRDNPKQQYTPKRSEKNKNEKYTPLPRTTPRDLLRENNIEWWSPHDLRRTLTKFTMEQSIGGGASAILAHEIKGNEVLEVSTTAQQREDFLKEHMVRITRLAYGGQNPFIKLKSEAMKLWTDAILDEYEEQKKKFA